MRRPKVTLRCPADQYHGQQERIIEFSHVVNGEPRGGLISFLELANGELIVNVYRTDPGVRVVLAERKPPPAHEYREDEEERMGAGLADMLRLRREPGKKGWSTGWGWKTSLGLFRMLRSIMQDIDAGNPTKELKGES